MESGFGFPRNENADVRVFNACGSSVVSSYQLWEKPRGCSMVFMLAIGAGAGGGGGFTGIAGSARGGGGGGGAGNCAKLLIPAFALPDRLYVMASTGAPGGAAGVVGGGTIASVISISPTISVAANMILQSNNATPSGGGAGTGSAGGAAGALGGNASQAVIAALGIFGQLPGTAAAAGGAQTGANGSAVTTFTGGVTTGGAGGGGTTSADFAGGAISGTGEMPTVPGGAAGSNPGNAGMVLMAGGYLFATTGGSGGGASNTSVGAAGGNGGIGSGGGGGGAGTTGGAGGRGGDGLVIIMSW